VRAHWLAAPACLLLSRQARFATDTASEHAQLRGRSSVSSTCSTGLADTASACRSRTPPAITSIRRGCARHRSVSAAAHPRLPDRRKRALAARPHNADRAITAKRRRTRHAAISRRLSRPTAASALRMFPSSWSATCPSSLLLWGRNGQLAHVPYVAGRKTASPSASSSASRCDSSRCPRADVFPLLDAKRIRHDFPFISNSLRRLAGLPPSP